MWWKCLIFSALFYREKESRRACQFHFYWCEEAAGFRFLWRVQRCILFQQKSILKNGVKHASKNEF